jgi:hypothetical protein
MHAFFQRPTYRVTRKGEIGRQDAFRMILRYLATGLVTLLLPLPALSVEPFRYRGAAKDGGILKPKKRDRSKSAARYRPAKEGEKRRGTRVAGGSRRVG